MVSETRGTQISNVRTLIGETLLRSSDDFRARLCHGIVDSDEKQAFARVN